MVSLKRVLVPTVRSFFPHIVVLTSCSRLATFGEGICFESKRRNIFPDGINV